MYNVNLVEDGLELTHIKWLYNAYGIQKEGIPTITKEQVYDIWILLCTTYPRIIYKKIEGEKSHVFVLEDEDTGILDLKQTKTFEDGVILLALKQHIFTELDEEHYPYQYDSVDFEEAYPEYCKKIRFILRGLQEENNNEV